MVAHEMRLHPIPFEIIRNGTKTVEMRLKDEKRQLIEVGDLIVFMSREDSKDTIMTKVIGIDIFPSFKEAYVAYLPSEYGGETADEWECMYQYYSPEHERKYGVLGIRVELNPQ